MGELRSYEAMKSSALLFAVVAAATIAVFSASELYEQEQELYQEILAEPDNAKLRLRGEKPINMVQASAKGSRRRHYVSARRRHYVSARRRHYVSSRRRHHTTVVVHTGYRRRYYGGYSRRRYHGAAVVACFPTSATVQSKTRGTVPIHEVKVGEEVMTHHGFSEVMFFAVHKPTTKADHLKITTSNATLVLTPSHGVFDAHGTPLLAGKLREGDTLLTAGVVEKIERVRGKGLVAPVTATGTLVVNGVATSDYGPLAQRMGQRAAHGVLAPLRLLRWIFPSWKLWHNHDTNGKHVLMNWGSSLLLGSD